MCVVALCVVIVLCCCSVWSLYCVVVVVIMITVVHAIVLFFVFTEGIQPLIGLLNSETPDVREASSLALANITTSNRTNCRYRQRDVK